MPLGKKTGSGPVFAAIHSRQRACRLCPGFEMDSQENLKKRSTGEGSHWPTAIKRSCLWASGAGVVAGCFALVDELRLAQPYDNIAEAAVFVVPLLTPALAGLWHRSWRVAMLLFGLLLAAAAVGAVVALAGLMGGWHA